VIAQESGEFLQVPAVRGQGIFGQALLNPAKIEVGLKLAANCVNFRHRANDTIPPELFDT
jgi:hypothetical protein